MTGSHVTIRGVEHLPHQHGCEILLAETSAPPLTLEPIGTARVSRAGHAGRMRVSITTEQDG
jgi:hypothetical protein